MFLFCIALSGEGFHACVTIAQGRGIWVPNTRVSSLQVLPPILPFHLRQPLRPHTHALAQLTGLKIFQNGVGIDIVAPLANGFMITSCFSFENTMVIPSDPQSLVANNLFK